MVSDRGYGFAIDRSRDFERGGKFRFIYAIGEGKGSGVIDLKVKVRGLAVVRGSVGVGGAVVLGVEAEGRAEGGSKRIVLGRVDGGKRGTAGESVVLDRGKFRSVREGNRGKGCAVKKSEVSDRGYRGRNFNSCERGATIESVVSDRGYRSGDVDRVKGSAVIKSALSDRSDRGRKRNRSKFIIDRKTIIDRKSVSRNCFYFFSLYLRGDVEGGRESVFIHRCEGSGVIDLKERDFGFAIMGGGRVAGGVAGGFVVLEVARYAVQKGLFSFKGARQNLGHAVGKDYACHAVKAG